MVKYEATYLPSLNDREDPSKKGLDTEDEAWEYASQWFCKHCKDLFDKGKSCMCDAEWMIDKGISNE